MKYIQIYDIECSASDCIKGDILTLACIILRADTMEMVDTFKGCARPENFNVWNPKAEEIHGISKDMARKFPPRIDLAIRLLRFLKPYKNEDNTPLLFGLHANNLVDFNFIEQMYIKEGIHDSFKKVASRDYTVRTTYIFEEYKKRNGLTWKGVGLNKVAEYLEIPLNHHDVLSDTMACAVTLKHMVDFFKGKSPIRGTIADFDVFNNLVKGLR